MTTYIKISIVAKNGLVVKGEYSIRFHNQIRTTMKKYMLSAIALAILGIIFFFADMWNWGWVAIGTGVACGIIALIEHNGEKGARKEAEAHELRVQEIKRRDLTLPNIKDFKLAKLPPEVLVRCIRKTGQTDWGYAIELFFAVIYEVQTFQEGKDQRRTKNIIHPNPELAIQILFGKKKKELDGEDRKLADSFFLEMALAKVDTVKINKAGNKLLKAYAQSKIEALK